MSTLPIAIHSTQQVRALDRYAIETLGIPGYELMTRAGDAALTALRSCWPATRRVLVVCGYGNNAGDGYVVARLAMAARMEVVVVALADSASLQGDAAQAWRDFVSAGGRTESWGLQHLQGVDVIVDALFGTGLTRDLDAGLIRCVDALNAAGRPILAIDVPSGLDADSGHVRGAAIRAERTVAFVGLKQGFYLADGPDCTGVVMFDDLGIPAGAADKVGCVARRIDNDALRSALPRRPRTSHKGLQGRVLVVGGGRGMAGAVRLTGEACLRVGAGLVIVATRPENVPAVLTNRPELICRGIESATDLSPWLEWADLIAIGPGLGQDEWSVSLFEAAVAATRPMVVDADALNLLATRPRHRDDWILTPHPGEAARLIGQPHGSVQSDRLSTIRRITDRYGGIVALKGAGTLVYRDGSLPEICDRGNPGMASPGMGDVLTGVIAGISVQAGDPWAGVRAGVLVHAMAGDMAARHGERGMIASDLFTHLPSCVNPLQHR